MSEMYSSASGSYQSYLSQRSADQITKTIKEENFKQNMMNFMYTGVLTRTAAEVGNKVDRMNANILRMSTGIQTSINQNTYAVAASSILLANTFNEGFDKLNNTLDLGFAGVQSSIGSMNASMSAGFDRLQKSIDTWGTEICEKLDAIHDIVNNPLLTASRELFRRAQSNAQKQFYEEALEDIKGAVEKNKTDYISWGLMGKIYLFGMSEFSNVVDVPKALEAFTNACKYITPDIEESNEAKNMAAEFYFYAGYANYILSNESRLENKTEDLKQYLEASVKANAKSYALADTMLEAAYNQARALTLLDQKNNAIDILGEIIRIDGLYSIKALGDEDFKNIETEIIELITNLRNECQTETKKIIQDFNNNYELIGGDYCEQIKELIGKCKELSDSDSPYLDVRAAYEAFYNEFESIKNNVHPMDLLVYENKFVKNTSDEYLIKDESYCYETELETDLSSPVWKVEDFTVERNKKTITFDKNISVLNKLYNNQVVLNNGGSLRALTIDGALLEWDDIKAYLQNNQYKKIFRPSLSYSFVQKKYGEKGKIVLKDNAFVHEYGYDKHNNSKRLNVEADDVYKETNNYKWELDKNTCLTLECLEKQEEYGQSPKRLVVFQHGIVSKEYLNEWEKKNLSREIDKNIPEKKNDEDDYVTLEITSNQHGLHGHKWNIESFVIGGKIQGSKESISVFITREQEYYEDTENYINGKEIEPVINVNKGAEIQVKKTDFFWTEGTYFDLSNRIKASKNDFWNDLEHRNLRLTFSVSEGLSLGILKENVELRKQRKAAKTRKRIIITSVIIAIIAVIGIIVF